MKVAKLCDVDEERVTSRAGSSTREWYAGRWSAARDEWADTKSAFLNKYAFN